MNFITLGSINIINYKMADELYTNPNLHQFFYQVKKKVICSKTEIVYRLKSQVNAELAILVQTKKYL